MLGIQMRIRLCVTILIYRRVCKHAVWLSHMDDWHTYILRACKFGVMSTVGFVMRSGAFLSVPSGSMALADQDECQTKTARAAQYPRHADSSIVHFPPTTNPPNHVRTDTHTLSTPNKSTGYQNTCTDSKPPTCESAGHLDSCWHFASCAHSVPSRQLHCCQ